MKTTITLLFILICSLTVFAQTKPQPEGVITDFPAENIYSSVFDIKDFKRLFIISMTKDPQASEKTIAKVIGKENSLELVRSAANAQFFIAYQESDAGNEMRVFYVKDRKVVIVWAETREKQGREADLTEAFLKVLRCNKAIIQPGITPSPQPAPERADGFKLDPTVGETSDSKTIVGGVLNGKTIKFPPPIYSMEARAERASGSVKVQVLIDEKGNVIEAKAVSGHRLLRPISEEAAKKAKFEPTTLEGQPAKVTGVLVYNYVP